MTTGNGLLTSTGLAKAMRLSRATILRLAKAGRIPVDSVTPGGHRRFDLDDVIEALGREDGADRDPSGQHSNCSTATPPPAMVSDGGSQ